MTKAVACLALCAVAVVEWLILYQFHISREAVSTTFSMWLVFGLKYFGLAAVVAIFFNAVAARAMLITGIIVDISIAVLYFMTVDSFSVRVWWSLFLYSDTKYIVAVAGLVAFCVIYYGLSASKSRQV
jgi:hypothetical protein